MRIEFAKVMVELAEKDPKIFLIILDVGGNTFSEFKERFPDRFYNLGVSEQATISFLSGLALEGFKPYVYSIAPFVLERPFEQLKLDVVQQNANVKIFGFWDYPTAGPTHKPLDVKKECEVLGLEMIEPVNSNELREKMIDKYNENKPCFFYIKRNPE